MLDSVNNNLKKHSSLSSIVIVYTFATVYGVDFGPLSSKAFKGLIEIRILTGPLEEYII